MTTRQNSSIAIVFILGLLAMLMPLSIDMYLPALPVISEQFGVPAGSAQMTLSTYILGFAVGQLLYGPMADSIGRKPVILGGTLVFAAAAVACALAQTIDQLIIMRFFHGLAALYLLDPRCGGYSGFSDDLYADQRNVARRASPAISLAHYSGQLCLAVSS